MTRESSHDKGRRYLTQARLNIAHVDAKSIEATCRSDHGVVYELGHDGRGWWCGCPAMRSCAHLTALRLVVTRSTR